jgi:hypothetical protein
MHQVLSFRNLAHIIGGISNVFARRGREWFLCAGLRVSRGPNDGFNRNTQ